MALASSATPPDRAVAQQVSLRLGALHARYSDSISGDAGSLGARLAWQAPRSRGTFETSWARYSSSDGAGQGWGSVAFIGPASASSALGVRADGVLNVASGVPLNGIGTAEVWAVHAVRRWSFGVSAGGGDIRDLAASERPVLTASLRAQLDLSAALSFSATAVSTAAGATHYTDGTVTATWQNARFQAGALAATRTGDLSYQPWFQAWGRATLSPIVSLEISGGSYPRDLMGFDHGLFVSGGARIALTSVAARQAAAASATTAHIAAVSASSMLAIASPDSGDIVLEPTDTARTRVTIRVDGVDSVAIAGDWNEWQPAAMTPEDRGKWTAVIPARTGTHRFALRLNGARWFVPSSVTKLPDDFGGEVGLLVVP